MTGSTWQLVLNGLAGATTIGAIANAAAACAQLASAVAATVADASGVGDSRKESFALDVFAGLASSIAQRGTCKQ
jgi:hypothetical protein